MFTYVGFRFAATYGRDSCNAMEHRRYADTTFPACIFFKSQTLIIYDPHEGLCHCKWYYVFV